jgi:hypothetical protein|tara:strand:+ start:14985 stop:15791 length:807 start_codon:yes stop_codon:yes gene_type:complete
MYVIKASGKKEEFKPKKIFNTLLRAGASRKLADEIVKEVQKRVREGTTTREILDIALGLLKNKNPEINARYDLKRAVMRLGPTGFPFEKFFAEVLENYGYQTQVGKIVQGKLINHEIDVVAKKDKNYMVECKYHNSLGIYTNIKVALYVYARFLDLKEKFGQPWLSTNTRLSRSAITYTKGVGMKVTSWQYPKEDCLRSLIEKKKLYPITILKTIDDSVKFKLVNSGIVLAIKLLDYDLKDLKRKTGISENILKKIMDEAKGICKIKV